MERHLRSTQPARPLPSAPTQTGTPAPGTLPAAPAIAGRRTADNAGSSQRRAPSQRTEQDAIPADAVADTAAFAHAARLLATEARRRGLVAPGFRSPPRLVGVDRSIRRHPNGAAVAVRVRNRPWVAVAADMIEGVIAANRTAPPRSDRLRAELWSALGFAPAATIPAPRRHAA